MPNPSHLLVDSDSLIQILMARERAVLAALRQRAHVMPAVVPEVEREVRNHQKFRQRFEPEFLRTVKAGNLVVLERAEVRRILSARGIPSEALDGQLQEIEDRAIDYNVHVDEGEAYTHAMAAGLGLPVMSHDWKAVTLLRGIGKLVGHPTLRLFDILVFAFERGWVTEDDCEKARKILKANGEYVPGNFNDKKPFGQCAQGFACRLRVATGHDPLPRTPTDTLFLEVS